jgi:hypothetical protein
MGNTVSAMYLCRHLYIGVHTWAKAPNKGLNLCANQIKTSDACADQIKTSDVVSSDVLSSGWKCECAFHDVLPSVFFSSELHDKGQSAGQPITGQQNPLRRPAHFAHF